MGVHFYASTLFLKHQEGSTQHETSLEVSPGSLHMNTSIENTVYIEFAKKKRFWTAHVSSSFFF